MELFKKKEEEFSEEELLKELERETAELNKLPPPSAAPAPVARPPMPPPAVQRPISPMPMPSAPQAPRQRPQMPPPPPIRLEEAEETPAYQPMTQFPRPQMLHPPVISAEEEEKPALSDQQVAKLPLFMKVEEYDRIVSELHTLVSSLEKINGTVEEVSKLEQDQREETDKLTEQLTVMRMLLNKLVAHMPETGRVKNIVDERKKHQQKEKIKEEISGLQKDLKKVSAPAKKPPEQLGREIQDLQSNIAGIQTEMQALHEELKNLAEIAKQRAAEEKKPSYHAFPKPEYKKTEIKKPW